MATKQILSEMKSVLYISFVNYALDANLGVIRKIEGQKAAFVSAGYKVSHLKLNVNKVCYNDETIFTFNGVIDFYWRLPLFLSEFMKQQSFDIVYIRKAYFTPAYFFLYKTLRKVSGKILLELPVYPYWKELKSWKKKLSVLLFDETNTLLSKSKIDKIVTVQDYEKIYGKPTIKITNAYDFAKMDSVIKKEKQPRTIRLITVANFSFWHGIDRVLHGINEYYNKYPESNIKIEFDLVGLGVEWESLKKLANDLQLKGINFHGTRKGSELDEIYSNADIGIGSLGLFRLNLKTASSLKNHEYCFYGIPFLLGYPSNEDAIADFVMEISNDNTSVDIAKLIEWYRNIKVSYKDIQNTGKELYSWDKQIRKILDGLN